MRAVGDTGEVRSSRENLRPVLIIDLRMAGFSLIEGIRARRGHLWSGVVLRAGPARGAASDPLPLPLARAQKVNCLNFCSFIPVFCFSSDSAIIPWNLS